MLEGSLWDKILIYAFPLAATGILQQLFNAADIAAVGRFTGSMASLCMAAMGANTPIVGLIVNLFVGISLVPSLLTVLGVCGVRIGWIYTVFQHERTFPSILSAYPASMAATAVFLVIAVLILKPSEKEFQIIHPDSAKESKERTNL